MRKPGKAAQLGSGGYGNSGKLPSSEGPGKATRKTCQPREGPAARGDRLQQPGKPASSMRASCANPGNPSVKKRSAAEIGKTRCAMLELSGVRLMPEAISEGA